MKRVLVEVGTFADAVAKANRISPIKGAAFDRACGIVVDVDPARTEQMIVMATDTEVSLRQVVSLLEVGDEATSWRIPAPLLHGFMQTLDAGVGSQIELKQFDKDPNTIYLLNGKTKAKLRLISGSYPNIEPYAPHALGEVQGLARRLQQVAWACDRKADGALAGVHITGDKLIACDRSRLAIVPCVVPVDRPVTAPLSEIASLLKNTNAVKMRAAANHLEVMPDDWTQTTALLIEADFPNVERLIKETYTGSITVDAEEFKSALDRMMVLVKSDRFPRTTIQIGLNQINLEMEVPEVGMIVDEVEGVGGDVDPFRITFMPTSLLEAVTASGRARVKLDYGPTEKKSYMRVTDDDHFMALLTPMMPGSK